MQEIRWVALEYPHKKRSVDWFWGLGIGAIIAAGVSIYLGNTLFAILVLTGALSIGMFALREPKEIEYIISEKRISLGERNHRYADLESFYVSEREYGHHKLILTSKKFLSHYIIIPILDHEPEAVREFLLRKLPEVSHDEPLLHIIAERLGI